MRLLIRPSSAPSALVKSLRFAKFARSYGDTFFVRLITTVNPSFPKMASLQNLKLLSPPSRNGQAAWTKTHGEVQRIRSDLYDFVRVCVHPFELPFISSLNSSASDVLFASEV